MILLIDAYNVIRFLHPGPRQAHDAQVAWFLSRLSAYWCIKKTDLKQIIVVFDGGLFSHKTREIVGGIVTVYAGGGRKADDVLVLYAKEFREQGLLITNDRELQRRSLAFKAGSMDVVDFWQLVEAVHERQAMVANKQEIYGGLSIMKYSSDEADEEMLVDAEVLDQVMIAGSVSSSVVKVEEGGCARSLSGTALAKKDKIRLAIRKKLG
jgi:predicted RNA-binding protein with PIN domain